MTSTSVCLQKKKLPTEAIEVAYCDLISGFWIQNTENNRRIRFNQLYSDPKSRGIPLVCSFLHNGTALAGSSHDGSLYIWDLRTQQEIQRIRFPGTPRILLQQITPESNVLKVVLSWPFTSVMSFHQWYWGPDTPTPQAIAVPNESSAYIVIATSTEEGPTTVSLWKLLVEGGHKYARNCWWQLTHDTPQTNPRTWLTRQNQP